jgi:hypothetical protein
MIKSELHLLPAILVKLGSDNGFRNDLDRYKHSTEWM